jgi:hypothetical protein
MLRQHGLRVTGQGHDDAIDAKVVTTRDLVGPGTCEPGAAPRWNRSSVT